MKKILCSQVLLLFIACLWMSSCVTKGKYLISENHNSQLQGDSANTHKLLNECNGQVASLQSSNDQLKKENEELTNSQNELKNMSNESKLTIEQQRKRLADLEHLLQSQRDAMNKLKKTISDALENYKSDELSVYVKDGKVYVSMQEKLLFPSGSDVVNPQGRQALGTLANVLNSTTDVDVEVEGHTDSVPIHNSKFADNWALSTGRAVSVVRILSKDDGFDPHRIIASGRSKYHPVQSNDTPGGRAANRRTDIILSPNLSELYQLLAVGS